MQICIVLPSHDPLQVPDSMFTLFRVMSGAQSDGESEALDSDMAVGGAGQFDWRIWLKWLVNQEGLPRTQPQSAQFFFDWQHAFRHYEQYPHLQVCLCVLHGHQFLDAAIYLDCSGQREYDLDYFRSREGSDLATPEIWVNVGG